MTTTAAHGKFYRTLFEELSALIKRWDKIEEESGSRFATLANVSSRVQSLQGPTSDLGVLRQFEGLPTQMLNIQLSGLESTVQILWKAYNLLESISKDLDRLSQSGTQYYESSSISGAEVLRVTVTSASIAQSLEWLQYISNAFKRELLEKKNILERLDYTNPEGISFFCDQWTSPIHLDYGIISDYVTRGKGLVLSEE